MGPDLTHPQAGGIPSQSRQKRELVREHESVRRSIRRARSAQGKQETTRGGSLLEDRKKWTTPSENHGPGSRLSVRPPYRFSIARAVLDYYCCAQFRILGRAMSTWKLLFCPRPGTPRAAPRRPAPHSGPRPYRPGRQADRPVPSRQIKPTATNRFFIL